MNWTKSHFIYFVTIRLCSEITCLSHVSTASVTALQGKRGIEKQPFQLPDFIAATGIEKIRQVRLVFLSVLMHIILINTFYNSGTLMAH